MIFFNIRPFEESRVSHIRLRKLWIKVSSAAARWQCALDLHIQIE